MCDMLPISICACCSSNYLSEYEKTYVNDVNVICCAACGIHFHITFNGLFPITRQHPFLSTSIPFGLLVTITTIYAINSCVFT